MLGRACGDREDTFAAPCEADRDLQGVTPAFLRNARAHPAPSAYPGRRARAHQ